MQSSVVVLCVLLSVASAVTVGKDSSYYGFNSTSDSNSTSTGNSTIPPPDALSFQHVTSTFLNPWIYNVTGPLFVVPEPFSRQPFFTWPDSMKSAINGTVVLTKAGTCVPFCYYMALSLNASGALGLIIADDVTSCDRVNNDCGNRALLLFDADSDNFIQLPTVGISECTYKALLSWAGIEESNYTEEETPFPGSSTGGVGFTGGVGSTGEGSTGGVTPLFPGINTGGVGSTGGGSTGGLDFTGGIGSTGESGSTGSTGGTGENDIEAVKGLMVLLSNIDTLLPRSNCTCENSSPSTNVSASSSTGGLPTGGWTGGVTGGIDTGSSSTGGQPGPLLGETGIVSSATSTMAAAAGSTFQALVILGIVKVVAF